MISPDVNTAIITGHPAHGLRIYRFLEIYKPSFYVITDGSGSKGGTRIGNAVSLIENCAAKSSPVMCRFTDAEMYRMMKEYDTTAISNLVDEIVEDLEKNDIDLVVGDALEGFNPTHDLCRYLVNAVVKIYSRRKGREVSNFDFLLDGPPDACPDEFKNGAIWINLDKDEFGRKMDSIMNYPGITPDIERSVQHYGEIAFQTECLRPVQDLHQYISWDTEKPLYESYGARKVAEGVYSEVISFEKHLLPLAEFLTDYSDNRAISA